MLSLSCHIKIVLAASAKQKKNQKTNQVLDPDKSLLHN